MKKITLLSVLFLFTFFTSCSEDEATALVAPNGEVTTWKIHKVVIDGVEQSFGPCNVNDKMDMNVNGTGVIQGYYQNDELVCLSSEPINFVYSVADYKFNISYTLNDNQYQFSEDILEYSAEQFTINVSDRFAGTDSDMEVIATYKKI